jgi:hypothetical protein
MPSKLERRLTALERHQHHRGPMVLVIRGGVTGGDPTYAKAGELRFQRADDETFPAFQARAVAAVATAGERFVVIGGLQE